jgi:hypothetical protein
MHSSILQKIWLNFMAQYMYLFFSALVQFSLFFRISKFFGLSTTEETWLVEMRIWCIKIGNVLVYIYVENRCGRHIYNQWNK